MSRLLFPMDFLRGAATSAYPIEGIHNENSKRENNRDIFEWERGCRKHLRPVHVVYRTLQRISTPNAGRHSEVIIANGIII